MVQNGEKLKSISIKKEELSIIYFISNWTKINIEKQHKQLDVMTMNLRVKLSRDT